MYNLIEFLLNKKINDLRAAQRSMFSETALKRMNKISGHLLKHQTGYSIGALVVTFFAVGTLGTLGTKLMLALVIALFPLQMLSLAYKALVITINTAAFIPYYIQSAFETATQYTMKTVKEVVNYFSKKDVTESVNEEKSYTASTTTKPPRHFRTPTQSSYDDTHDDFYVLGQNIANNSTREIPSL